MPTSVFLANIPKKRTAIYTRPSNPIPRKFTARDGRILEAIHAYDGMLADYQIKYLFFTGETQLRLRMRFLYQHGYVARPDYKRRASLNHMVYWLDTKGAAYVAGLAGAPLEDFVYLKEPRWSQLDHDLAISDVRITFTKACEQNQTLSLEQWIPQSEFYSRPDKVEYIDPNGKKAHRNIRPDGYIIVRKGGHLFRLLLELDMSSEDNHRIGREKVLPGIAYIESKVYAQRFGHNSGRWLFVTTSERRLRNMKRQTEVVAGKAARLFYFTTFEQVTPDALLTGDIWWQGMAESPTALFRT